MSKKKYKKDAEGWSILHETHNEKKTGTDSYSHYRYRVLTKRAKGIEAYSANIQRVDYRAAKEVGAHVHSCPCPTELSAPNYVQHHQNEESKK